MKIQTTARKVSGIIEIRPSTVAKPAPIRIPRYDGMKKSRIPTAAIARVHQAMKVSIGVNPAVVFRLKRSQM